MRRFYGSGANDYNASRYLYDDLNRRCFTQTPAAPLKLSLFGRGIDQCTTDEAILAGTSLPGDDTCTAAITKKGGVRFNRPALEAEEGIGRKVD